MMMTPAVKVTATIAEDTFVTVDGKPYSWPIWTELLTPKSFLTKPIEFHTDMRFTCSLTKGRWVCVTDGFGADSKHGDGEYGYGPVTIRNSNGIVPDPQQSNVIAIDDIVHDGLTVQYNDNNQTYILLLTRTIPCLLVKGYVVVGAGYAVELEHTDPDMIKSFYPLRDPKAVGTIYVFRNDSSGLEPMALYRTTRGVRCKTKRTGIPLPLSADSPDLDRYTEMVEDPRVQECTILGMWLHRIRQQPMDTPEGLTLRNLYTYIAILFSPRYPYSI